MLIIESRQFRLGKRFYIITGVLMFLAGMFGPLFTMHVHLRSNAPDPSDPEAK